VAAGLRLTAKAIARGLADADWPARLELIALDSGRRVVLDAAHNPDGASALAAYLARWHPERPPLVFAAMHDKDIDGILRALLPVVGPIVVTRPETHRAESPATLAARVHALDQRRAVHVEDDPLEAVNFALALASTICVAGSIFLAGAVRDGLQRRAILP
jgi:dihydrofolate synthase / folylpolyglutamate synthase